MLPLVLLLQVATAAPKPAPTAIPRLQPDSVAGESFVGKVVGIRDGDTIDVLHSGKAQTVRLNCIDAPENGQAFGTLSKQLASAIAFGKDVRVRPVGRDKYGRTVGDVILPDGSSMNRRMVESGLAWNYVQYCKDPEFARLHDQAKAAGVGLWRDKNPEAPWLLRKETPAPSQARNVLSEPHPTSPAAAPTASRKVIEIVRSPSVSGTGSTSGSSIGGTSGSTGDRTIHTGPKGGRYYYTDSGTKVYVPRESGGSSSGSKGKK